MAEIEGLVRALREGDDDAKAAAAAALSELVRDCDAGTRGKRVRIREAGGIPPLVQLVRDGSAEAKTQAAAALANLTLTYTEATNRRLVGAAGATSPLIDLLRDGSAEAKLWAASALRNLACENDNKMLITEAGGVPLFVQLLRDGCAKGKLKASAALSSLALNNDAGAVAVAVAVGLEALVELARHGRVIVNEGWLVWSADVPAKRKAALVVAALLDRDGRRLPREIKALIGPYL
ncbi:hypothetical protein SO694_00037129 [Aureococcus anophagefferens]|uniref:Vacuolar protein 8 n=1 Tax=Aureococcus anophagefferens TaxID=44056 RepID=A0ABR1FKW2_AURAN|nr:hypothetical protein JL721_2429 [Aureococcus anophagefferens]